MLIWGDKIMLIGMNELCLCGSGKKFKKCCRNLIDYNLSYSPYDFNVLNLKQIIDDVYKKNKKSKCLYPSCNGFAIDSHSIQKGGVLKLLSENDEVCHNFINYNTYKMEKVSQKEDSKDMILRIGGRLGYGDFSLRCNLNFYKDNINNVSVFKGFCNKHDTEIFKNIEFKSVNDITFHNNDEEVFLYCYRLFSYFYKVCKIETEIMQRLFKNNINCFYNNKGAICQIRECIKEFNRLDNEKCRLDKHIINKSFNLFNKNYVVLPYKVSFFSMSLLPMIVNGKVCFSYIFVIPTVNETHIYFCWDKNEDIVKDGLIEYFDTLNTIVLSNLILLSKTRIVVTPSKISKIENNSVLKKLLICSDFFEYNKELRLNMFDNITKDFGIDFFNL